MRARSPQGFVALLVTLAEKVGIEVRWPGRPEFSGKAIGIRRLVGDLRRTVTA